MSFFFCFFHEKKIIFLCGMSTASTSLFLKRRRYIISSRSFFLASQRFSHFARMGIIFQALLSQHAFAFFKTIVHFFSCFLSLRGTVCWTTSLKLILLHNFTTNKNFCVVEVRILFFFLLLQHLTLQKNHSDSDHRVPEGEFSPVRQLSRLWLVHPHVRCKFKLERRGGLPLKKQPFFQK